ncbi:MAG: HK97 gp10 family phage protein, partial [Paenisporosarcina sp.]
MITAKSSGSFKNTTSFLEYMKAGTVFKSLDHYGRIGVDALSRATPRDTGETANSWGYQIGHENGIYSISWYNTHREGFVNIAVIIQYGHGTGTGGYVEGIDYINPAIRPIFEKIVNDIWRQ